jgi:hypothetical protein
MEFVTPVLCAVVLVAISGAARANNTPAEKEKRHKEMMERFEQRKKEHKQRMKKQRFITNFIDEIPELSYYEAAQLNKKLGNIYLEWNDE